MQFRRKLYRSQLPIWESVEGVIAHEDCATKSEFLFALGSTTVRGTKNKRAPQ